MTEQNVPVALSLRTILPAAVLIALITAILGVSLSTLRGTEQKVVRNIKSDLMWRTVRVSETLQRLHMHNDLEGMQQLITSFGADPNIVGAWLLDSNDIVTGATQRQSIGLPARTIFAGYDAIRYEERAAYARSRQRVAISVAQNQMIAVASVPLGGGTLAPGGALFGMFVIITSLNGPIAEERYLIQRQAVNLSLIMSVAALLMVAMLHILITRRVTGFAAAARQLAAGDLNARMKATGRDELAYMARSFNTMVERICASQRALIESEERFRTVAKATNDAVWDWNLLTNLIWWNEGVYTLFKYSHDKVQPEISWWNEHIHPDDRDHILNDIHTVINGQGDHWLAEYRFLRADNSYADILDRGFVMRDSSGKPVRMIGAMQDISLRKKAERDLRALNEALEERIQERTRQLEVVNKELESFAYSVSHDLRAPLRALSGFSQALAEDYTDTLDGTAKDYLNRIKAASQRMGQLIDDLLKLSRVTRTELQLKKISLSELVTKVCTAIKQSEPQYRVVFNIEPDVSAYGDPKLLEIALDNLLNNAWKFTHKAEKPCIEFGKKELQGETVYFVSDNGAGFNMDYVSKLFKPFERLHSATEFEGTGIGLSIVSRIILRHGGRVWAESEEGKGATFYFTLPENKNEQRENMPSQLR